jgi:DNA-directed RNA polymerase specialized sigma24 family protein
MSGVSLQSGEFQELALPLFDQLYNFAHWLTQNREEAEDLVQETYTKALGYELLRLFLLTWRRTGPTWQSKAKLLKRF